MVNLRLAQVVASWDLRSGDKAAADRVLHALNGDLALAMVVPALKAHLATIPVRTATDGLAEAYVNLAGALQDQQNSQQVPAGVRLRNQQTTLILLQLALQLRPDFTAARLLLSDVTDTGHNAAEALAPLAGIGKSDPLYPLAAMRRAVLETRLGEDADARRMLSDLAAAIPGAPSPCWPWGISSAAARTTMMPPPPSRPRSSVCQPAARSSGWSITTVAWPTTSVATGRARKLICSRP